VGNAHLTLLEIFHKSFMIPMETTYGCISLVQFTSARRKQYMSNNEQALPFFARYLEGQFCEDLSEEEMSEVQGGLRFAHPTRPKKDEILTTLKYPSDNEDGGGSLTKKYPSDQEEHLVTTLKYPSDGEDSVVTIDTVNTTPTE
jgi:hypothetical protein